MTDEESLVAAHHARLEALLAGNLTALAQVVGEDMIYISPAGEQRTRAEVFASFEAGSMRIEHMASRDIETRLYGDIGILIYTADARMVDGETTITGTTRSTTVYQARDQGWQMVSQHQCIVGHGA